MTKKSTVINVRIDDEIQEKIDSLMASRGVDRSGLIRQLITEASQGKQVQEEGENIRLMLAEAVTVILASQGRNISTPQAKMLTRELFLGRAFKEDFQ